MVTKMRETKTVEGGRFNEEGKRVNMMEGLFGGRGRSKSKFALSKHLRTFMHT